MHTSRRLLLVLSVLVLASTVRAAEPDRLIPADAESVTIVNVKQTVAAPLVKKYALDLLKSAIESQADVLTITKPTGLDVTKDIDTILVTTSGGLDGKVLLIAHGTFDQSKCEAALAEHARKNPGELKIGKVDNATIYETINEGKSSFVAFADAKTFVASQDKKYLAEALKRQTGTPTPVRKELADLLRNANGKESVYAALVVTDELKKSLEAVEQTKDLAKTLKALTASVTVNDDIHIDVTATTTDAKTAQQLASAVNTIKNALPALVKTTGNEQFVPLAEAVQKNMKLAHEGNTATLNLKLTEDVIKKAVGN
jgi:hypothetical protein